MLHVLTGTVKGRKLKVPKGRMIRPTTGRVKKSMFDTLGDISEWMVLDVFSGSGGLGIESLSRGAAHVTFIEKNPSVFKILSENVAVCGFLDKATLISRDYMDAIKRLGKKNELFDLIFIDPPYKLYSKLDVEHFILSAAPLLEDTGVIVIEHNYKMDGTPKGFNRRTKPFGETQLSYFGKEAL